LVKSRDNGEFFVAKLCQKQTTEAGDEYTVLASLDFPAIPKIEERFETEDTVCILREYVDGQTLDKLDTPLTESRTLDIGIQLCGILTYLHSQSPPIIHRDIKPSNVILDPEGGVHLIDFGISRQFSGSASKDTSLMVTEGYAPPEQYGFKQTDCRADLYSLGVLLCFLLTGERDLEALTGPGDQKLARVIRKCAAFAPESRYPTAEAVKRALLGLPGKRTRQLWTAAAIVPLVIAAAVIAWPFHEIETPPDNNVVIPSEDGTIKPPIYEGVVFTEPLIEQAARLALRLPDDAELTEYDLTLVEEVYINFDKAFDNIHDFWGYYVEGLNISGTGAMTSLEDLRMMPSLKRVFIHNQRITDIEPLSQLALLSVLDLDRCDITDLSPLAGAQSLQDISIGHASFTDISPLLSLPSLTRLHIVRCNDFDVRRLRDFRGLREITIGNPTFEMNHYKYLPEIPLEHLNLEFSSVDSLEWFSMYKPSLRHLSLAGTSFLSIEGIEEFKELQTLRITFTHIADLTPLLLLPNLREVYIDSSMQGVADSIRDRAEFEFVVEA
jgi:hypothetical protein